MRNFILIIITIASFCINSLAQEEQKTISPIQFSGLVVAGDSSFGIPFVHIFVNGTNRGSVSNTTGFYSFPVLPGDTVTFSCLGFKNQQIIVPIETKDKQSTIVYMQEETLNLPEVEVNPYHSIELFKQAFVSMKPGPSPIDILNNPAVMEGMKDMPYTGYARANNQVNAQINNYNNEYTVPTTNYLNPVQWARFIKSLKKK